MKTIRRFYFYLISLISIQVVLWAVINLLRTIFSNQTVTGVIDWLAGGIAFILVGAPIFLLHWTTAQREARRDDEEQGSRIRALFFYTAILSTGIPISYAVLAIVNRLLVQAFGLPSLEAILGADQTHIDNLVALAANLVVLVYFWRSLQQDWHSSENNEARIEVSRLHRYIWMLYGLILLIFGLQQVLRYIFALPPDFGRSAESILAGGLAIVIVGLPTWLVSSRAIQRSLVHPMEEVSSLRLVILYLLTIGGLGITLVAMGILVANGLRWAFQVESWNIRGFIDAQAGQLAAILTMGAVWGYYRHALLSAFEAAGDEIRQAELRRIYSHILAFGGLAATFLGLVLLLGAMVEALFSLTVGNIGAMLSDALALLAIGLPLWLRFWTEIQKEASLSTEAGIHARRSPIRKGYLYLVLFVTVVGTMVSTGWWLYDGLKALLDTTPPDFWMNFFLQLRLSVLFAIFLLYHINVLRSDGREGRQAMTKRRTGTPVVFLQMGESTLIPQIIAVLTRKAPDLPFVLHRLDQVSLEENLLEARVIVMTASLAVNQPDVLRTSLKDFSGEIVVIPNKLNGWHWLGSISWNEQRLVQEAAATVLQLAEGQPVRLSPAVSAWSIFAYILAGLFTLQILVVAIAALLNLIFG